MERVLSSKWSLDRAPKLEKRQQAASLLYLKNMRLLLTLKNCQNDINFMSEDYKFWNFSGVLSRFQFNDRRDETKRYGERSDQKGDRGIRMQRMRMVRKGSEMAEKESGRKDKDKTICVLQYKSLQN